MYLCLPIFNDEKEMICKNCGTEFEGNFCNHCGQKSTVERLTWRSVWDNILHGIFHVDNTFVKTTRTLVVHPDRQLELSEHGWELATAVMRKHRLAECLLTDVIGLDLALVHDEACRWEHVVSHAVEQRITDLLDAPERSPYGNRIPRLDVADLRAQAEASASTATLAEVLAGPGEASVVLDRISEFAQADAALLALLLQAGLRPGVTLVADRDEDGLRLRCADAAPDAGVEVGLDVAHLLFVGVPRR